MIFFNISSSIVKNYINIIVILQNGWNKFEKNPSFVQYPETLDLTPFCSVASPVSKNTYVFRWKVMYINCLMQFFLNIILRVDILLYILSYCTYLKIHLYIYPKTVFIYIKENETPGFRVFFILFLFSLNIPSFG